LASKSEARALENTESRWLQAVAETAVIAHDLNTLLTVIVGNAEFLSEKLEAREDLQQLAQDIATAGDRGAELTRRLVAVGHR
jgi:signal transduction histidine kinase